MKNLSEEKEYAYILHGNIDPLINKINELVNKVNKLEKALSKSRSREFFNLKEKNGPGEIGWDNGEFYKD